MSYSLMKIFLDSFCHESVQDIFLITQKQNPEKQTKAMYAFHTTYAMILIIIRAAF